MLVKKGEHLIIIDCQSFVPEHIPVLKAICQQNEAFFPFDNGELINISYKSNMKKKIIKKEAINEVIEVEELNDHGESEEKEEEIFIEHLYVPESDFSLYSSETQKRITEIAKMIEESRLDPIKIIRRNPELKKKLKNELIKLAIKATLDDNQFISFIQSLTAPVHCTQGPPGTGIFLILIAILLLINFINVIKLINFFSVICTFYS
jgi:hypothetical protein